MSKSALRVTGYEVTSMNLMFETAIDELMLPILLIVIPSRPFYASCDRSYGLSRSSFNVLKVGLKLDSGRQYW